MSVREEPCERPKNNCPSRGLGLAAAAIGVGVGAALYYFFSKRPENPDSEGSTSQDWTCEQPQTLNDSLYNEDAYTTISENTTSDTSVHNTDSEDAESSDSDMSVESGSEEPSTLEISSTEDSIIEISDEDVDTSALEEYNSVNINVTGYLTFNQSSEERFVLTISDSDISNEWDVTDSSIGLPVDERASTSPMQRFFGRITTMISPRREMPSKTTEQQQMDLLRAEAFRERSWSLEECSICFEVMLKDQELMSLPCTHNFHVQCIGPWLQEHQTCPNCRKAAE